MTRLLCGLIWLYRMLVSPLLGAAASPGHPLQQTRETALLGRNRSGRRLHLRAGLRIRAKRGIAHEPLAG